MQSPQDTSSHPTPTRRHGRFAQALFFLHRWISFPLGFAFGLVCLSGACMVFADAWDRALHPSLLSIPGSAQPMANTLHTLETRLQETFQQRPIQRIRLPQKPTHPIEICFASKDPYCVYYNPISSAFLGGRYVEHSAKRWLLRLHSHLLLGEIGETILGVLGCLLFVTALSGLFLWWPSWNKTRRGRSTASPGLVWHRWGGIILGIPLLLTCLTGISLAFEKPVEHALQQIFRDPPRPPIPRAMPTSHATVTPSLDTFWQRAEEALPGGHVVLISFPKKAGDPVVVRKKMPGEWHPSGRSFVYLHPNTADVLALEDARLAPTSTRVRNMWYPLHTGTTGGIATQVLQLVVGIAPLSLMITGLLAWRSRQRKKRAQHST